MALTELAGGRVKIQIDTTKVESTLLVRSAATTLYHAGGNVGYSDHLFSFEYKWHGQAPVSMTASRLIPIDDVYLVFADDPILAEDDNHQSGIAFVMEYSADSASWVASNRYYQFNEDEATKVTRKMVCMMGSALLED